MIKQTCLYREVMLRVKASKITAEYFDLKKKGLLSWEAYKEHREDIQKSFGFLRRAIARYKDRRIEAGCFYIRKDPILHKVFVMSPLYTMPRKDALKKIRQILQKREAFFSRPRRAARFSLSRKSQKKREAYASICNKGPLATHGSNLARCLDLFGNIGRRRLVQLLLTYLFVIILACFIIFYD